METTNLFTGKAKDYSQYRPHYPEAFIDYLIAACGLDGGKTIADIGSGTGILTGQMLGRGLRVIGVEPNGDMRKAAEEQLGKYPVFTSVAAAAEETSLKNGSIDLITVAQAFHWFDVKRFQTECRRILKAEGQVVLVWNNRDENDAVTREIDEICKMYCPAFKGFSGGMQDRPNNHTAFFKEGLCERKTFQNPLKYDLESFIGRNLSSSYAPKPEDGQYDAFVKSLADVFGKYSKDGVLNITYVTQSYRGNI